MRPANTELAAVDLGTPALQWPDMRRVTISLASPDETGAVAYYFDTLVEASQVGNIELVGKAGRAACRYLLGLAQSKGLELVRGPFLTMAPEHGPLPDGWWMVRAIVWAEEFDHLVPTGTSGDQDNPEHLISVREASKMDASGLQEAVCSCGQYRSAPTSYHGALRAGRQHVIARDGTKASPLYYFRVNGKSHTSVDGYLTYRVVCELAGYGEKAQPTVVWSRPKMKQGGTLAPGESLNIPPRGVSFDVAVTGGA